MADDAPIVLPSFFPAARNRVLTSPFQFGLTGSENLRVTSFNSLAGVTIVVNCRFLDPSGAVTWQQFTHVPNTDRSSKTTDFPLGAGYILNLTAFAQNATPVIGQTFIQVKIIGGLGGATMTLGTLLQGYVTSSQELAWPGSPISSSLDGGGYLRFVQGTTPIAGSPVVQQVPTGARWEIIACHVNLSPDATVATRRAIFKLGDAFASWMFLAAPGTVVAGSAAEITFCQGLAFGTAPDPLYIAGGLPVGLQLDAQQILTMFGENFQAGDRFLNPTFTVREWLEAQ